MPIVGCADRQNSGITAHTLRANTEETSVFPPILDQFPQVVPICD